MDIRDLREGFHYRIQRDFADFHHQQFTQGELLTFVESHFLPYHGGHTVVFKEKTLYLQEEVNSGILGSLEQYLRLETE
ncbi:MAG TPA: hypothetical protein VFS61_01970 [Anaerolineales bacterium]|nr:hypothetical protein [Anaerolineales bacterium]